MRRWSGTNASANRFVKAKVFGGTVSTLPAGIKSVVMMGKGRNVDEVEEVEVEEDKDKDKTFSSIFPCLYGGFVLFVICDKKWTTCP